MSEASAGDLAASTVALLDVNVETEEEKPSMALFGMSMTSTPSVLCGALEDPCICIGGTVALTWFGVPQKSTLVGNSGVGTSASASASASISSVEGAAGTGFPGTRIIGSGATAERQRGQVEWEKNHMSMHSKWKPWLHLGRRRNFSPSEMSERQTAHSRPSLKSEEQKVATGREWSTDSSRPRRRGAVSGTKIRRRECEEPLSPRVAPQ